MFNFKRLFAAVAVAATLTASTAALAQSATPGQAQIYLENNLNTDGAFNVYVDGTKMFENVFPGDFTTSTQSLAPGQHTVVVTKNSLAPGVADVVSGTINVAQGSTYTLVLEDNTAADAATGLIAPFDVSLSSGAPESD